MGDTNKLVLSLLLIGARVSDNYAEHKHLSLLARVFYQYHQIINKFFSSLITPITIKIGVITSYAIVSFFYLRHKSITNFQITETISANKF